MDVGTKVEMVFSLNKETVAARGVVVIKYPQVGNGIDFMEMAPDDRLNYNTSPLDAATRSGLGFASRHRFLS